MTFQPGATTVTLRGRWQAPDGTPAVGTVELSLESPLGDDAANVTYTQQKKEYPLDANGEISVQYVITGTTNPVTGQITGTKVNVKEMFEDTKTNKWITAFTAADITGTNEIWLADLSAVEPRPLNQYVLIGTYNNKMAEIETKKADKTYTDNQLGLKAPILNPVFTGSVTVPIASTATQAPQKKYVDDQDNLKAPLASPTFTGTVIVPVASGNTSPVQKTYVDAADALKAPLASPTFTGTVVVPVASGGTSPTQKTYVDTQDALKADKANPTFTGVLTTPNIVVSTGTAPALPNSTGTKGQIAYDTTYLYVCIATNSWKRIALPAPTSSSAW